MLIFNKKVKKVFCFVLILFFCAGFVLKTPLVIAQDPCTTDTDGDGLVDGMDPTNNKTGETNTNIINCNNTLQDTKKSSDVAYTLLEPIGDLKTFDASGQCPLVDYINKFLKIFLGICAALAMVMIVVGGLQYMTSELLSSKEEGVKNIQGAAFGFIMALAAYAFLNTINPDLLNFCPHIPIAQITVEPDAGDDNIDPGFTSGNFTYSTDASVTPSVTTAVGKLKDGWYISKINVYQDNTMQLDMKKGNQFDNSTYLGIAPGLNGYAPSGSAKTGDKKTPVGEWKIINVKYTPKIPQYNKSGSNMGAAFWHLSPMSSGERGIGIHGNKNGTLSPTNGCVRMKNSDILALQPYIKAGIPVIIH